MHPGSAWTDNTGPPYDVLKYQANNLSSTFGVREIPVDSQFRSLLDRHDYQPITGCFADWIARLRNGVF